MSKHYLNKDKEKDSPWIPFIGLAILIYAVIGASVALNDHGKITWEYYDAPTGLFQPDTLYQRTIVIDDIVRVNDTGFYVFKPKYEIDTVPVDCNGIFDNMTCKEFIVYKEVTERKRRKIKYSTK